MSSPPQSPPSDPSREPSRPSPARASGLRFRAWNLLLLVPLVALLTPLFNTAGPTLAGLPFFYWFQFAVIPLGVACTLAVHLMTRSTEEEGQ